MNTVSGFILAAMRTSVSANTFTLSVIKTVDSPEHHYTYIRLFQSD